MGSVLKLDFDWTPPPEWISRKMHLIDILFVPTTIHLDYTERGFHMIIETDKDLSEEEICMWQWVFGDDQDRARLNYARMKKGVKNWNKLFVRKIKK